MAATNRGDEKGTQTRTGGAQTEGLGLGCGEND